MKLDRTTKPDWATKADREIDLSDVWIDECDPQNEEGAEVIGYMTSERVLCSDRYHNDVLADGFELTGISVEIDGLRFFYNREAARKLIGVDAIWRVEQHEMEAAV